MMTEQQIDNPSGQDDVLVVQLTGRMHFGAARGLQDGGRLAGLLTDFHVPPPFQPLARQVGALNPYNIPLPPHKVFGSPLVGLRYRWRLKRHGHFRTETHVAASESLAGRAASLARRLDLSTVYSFDIQAVETFRALEEDNLRFVLEQCVAPRRTQMELLDRFSGLFTASERKSRRAQLDSLAAREAEEWRLAHRIVCPSDYVRDELARWGADPNKIVVVPYGFSRSSAVAETVRGRDPGSTLKAIFVGTVEPRKGLHDVIDALARLDDNAVHLDVFGSLARVDEKSYRRDGVSLHGKVSFDVLQKHYREADVLVLPSYLEGSATSVYEAMSYGLPCIVTREVGSVVRDGVEGFIVDPGSPDQISDCLSRLCGDPALRLRMGEAAMARAKDFTFEAYGRRLCTAL